MPPTQRLRRLQGHIGGARAEPAAGVLKWLQGLLGGGPVSRAWNSWVEGIAEQRRMGRFVRRMMHRTTLLGDRPY